MQKLQPTKEIIVDGDKYTVQLYPPTFGLTLYAKLTRLLGPSLIKLFSAFDLNALKGKSAADVMNLDLSALNLDALGSSLMTFFGAIKDDEVAPLIQEILSSTFVSPSNQPVNEVFEARFAGQYGHVFKLTAATLGVQYPGFLSGIAKRASAAPAALASVPAGKGSPT